MPHLALSADGWLRLVTRNNITSVAALNHYLGLPHEHVERVLVGQIAPSEEFIAACLAAFPVRFDDLFTIEMCAVA